MTTFLVPPATETSPGVSTGVSGWERKDSVTLFSVCPKKVSA